MALSNRNLLLICLIALILFTSRAHAFGAGNIASISAVEGRNWRHGDIEDVLKTLACIKHHKWNSMMIKRVYFGNWLRDYSQAMDTGALKKAPGETIRILVWLLSFLSFGYATAEFEVTSERLGVYRPEEHIDNPKDYNDNEDARKFDPRLRGPVRDVELQIDMETGMKNYIANGKGDWATSAAFVKHSFERSIHHGRLYTNGHGFFKGKDEDLAEALRCLGQGLHTLEDFGAHTNYVELAMIEMGYRNVYAHVGTATMVNVHGKHIWPLVTGTFGMVDFYHSVLGEATDHFTQSEVNEMDNALGTAQQAAQSNNPLFSLVKLLSKVPGTRELCDEAQRLQSASQQQAQYNSGGGWGGSRGVDDYSGSTRGMDDFSSTRSNVYDQQSQGNQNWNASQQGFQQQQNWNQQAPQQQSFDANQFPGSTHQWDQGQPQLSSMPPVQHTPSQPLQQPVSNQGAPQGLPNMPNFDPAKTVAQIYPILAFRDKVVRTISSVIEKIPGLEALVDRIVETLTVFILSLLAPFVRPILDGLSKTLQTGSEGVVNSSAKHQFEVWTIPQSSDPTHSMLSKDHFSNLLNEPAGAVAAEILKFIAPRVLYAWEHPDVPVNQVLRDVDVIFHHPALRNNSIEVHRTMFDVVQKWVNQRPGGGGSLEAVLSSEAVRAGKNHKAGVNDHAHVQHQFQAPQGGAGGYMNMMPHMPQMPHMPGQQQHGGAHSPFGMVGDMVQSFSGHGGQHQNPQYHQSSGGLGDVLNLANKLPIPGVQNFTSQINRYSKFLPGGSGGGGGHGMPFNLGGFGGGQRGLDDDGTSREVGDGSNQYQSGDDEGFAYGGMGVGSEIGGTRELHDAAHASDPNRRSPSPMPLAAPSGYEQYTATGQGYGSQSGGEGGGYGGQYQQQDQYQQQSQYGQQQQYGGGENYYGQQQQQHQEQGSYYGGQQGDNYYR